MSVRIKVVAFANGAPCPLAGHYLQSFDFEAERGRGYGVFTADPGKAMLFADAGSAWKFWRTTSKRFPKRLDGRPNRPLTATTVVIE